MIKFGSTLRLSALVLAGSIAGSALTGIALAGQPHMFAARDDLRHALNQLTVAEADKSGHRANAISLVNQAIGEVNAGIASGRGR